MIIIKLMQQYWIERKREIKRKRQWFRQNCSNSDKVTHAELGLGVLKEHRFKVIFQWKEA